MNLMDLRHWSNGRPILRAGNGPCCVWKEHLYLEDVVVLILCSFESIAGGIHGQCLFRDILILMESSKVEHEFVSGPIALDQMFAIGGIFFMSML
jgi:hypothetical protein